MLFLISKPQDPFFKNPMHNRYSPLIIITQKLKHVKNNRFCLYYSEVKYGVYCVNHVSCLPIENMWLSLCVFQGHNKLLEGFEQKMNKITC